MTQRQKRQSPAVFVITFVLLLALGGGGVAYWTITQTGGKPELASAPVTSLPALTQEARKDPVPKSTPKSAPKSAAAAAVAPAPIAAKQPARVAPSPTAPVAAPATTPAAPVTAREAKAAFSSRAEPPAVDSADIANFAAQTGTDKWFYAGGDERYGADAAKGLTFQTGDAPVVLNALTYKIASGSSKSATPNKPTIWTIRVGTLSGNNFTQISSKEAEQAADTGAGDYITWTFTTPVPIPANTTCAVDVSMRSNTDWQTGIPYLAISKNVTAPGVGVSYHSGDRGAGGATIAPSASIDRIFHVDLEPQ